MSGGLDDLLAGLTGGGGGGGQSGGGLGSLLGGLMGGGGQGGGGGGAGMAGMMAALAPMVGGFISGGGLSKMLSGFQSAGMQDKVDSWVSTGENQPLSAGDVQQAVSQEQIDKVAQRLGISQEEAAGVIADVLPNLVDKVSPDGQLASEEQLDKIGTALEQAGAEATASA
jgi:uncharacterized protein YidB (DUF937 family)